VRASGRRPEPASQGWRWFGLKVHARGLVLRADLEMHLVPSGYVGLCRLPDDEVNVCGLFRSGVPVPDLAQRWQDWLGGPTGSELHARLTGASLDPDSFCSIAALSLEPQHAADLPECAIGDALTMIPPVTGNGMSMAFESAEVALDPITRFSQGAANWTEVRAEIASNCDRTFRSRLRWARWLQRALFYPPARLALAALVDRSDRLWLGAFRRTR
jgi:2-polyprenyl-6-methoxyphenol hydroxylase-like FAD-dependent oxidoreductase